MAIQKLRGHKRGIFFALAAASFYGCVPNFARLAFVDGVPALETVLMRTGFIAILLGFIATWQGQSLKLPRAAWPSFLGQTFATFVVSTSYLASIQFISVGLAVIIFFAFPVIIIVLGPIVERKPLSMERIGIALLAFLGLAISIGPGFESLDIRGVLLAAAAAVGCALQFFTGRALGHFLQPAAFGSLVHIAIWPLVFLVAFYSGGQTLTLLAGNIGLSAYVFVGGVCLAYLGGYFLHMSSLKAAPASIVAPYFNLEPIVTTLISGVFLGETLKINQYGGAALVLAALVLAGFVGRRNDKA